VFDEKQNLDYCKNLQVYVIVEFILIFKIKSDCCRYFSNQLENIHLNSTICEKVPF